MLSNAFTRFVTPIFLFPRYKTSEVMATFTYRSQTMEAHATCLVDRFTNLHRGGFSPPEKYGPDSP